MRAFTCGCSKKYLSADVKESICYSLLDLKLKIKKDQMNITGNCGKHGVN